MEKGLKEGLKEIREDNKILGEVSVGKSEVNLITHDEKVAKRAERIIEISDGKIIN